MVHWWTGVRRMICDVGYCVKIFPCGRMECRKTCERRAKRTQILGMGYLTPRLALWQGSSACPANGRFLHGYHRKIYICQICIFLFNAGEVGKRRKPAPL